MAKRALVALERGEHDAALVRLVAVVEQVTGHGSSLPPSPPSRHQGNTLISRSRDPDLWSVTREMSLLADQFVGRAEELGSLDHALDELDSGRAAAIELVGEPGIGKTRLLAELAARAEARRHLVLAGSASELERDLPFSVFVDALDEYVEGLDPRRLGALDDDVQAELAHVFPSLSALAPGREVALQHERYRTHRAVRELLERLAFTRPLVLVLDDLHWADSASIELVGALLRRPPAAPVLMTLALRPRQTPSDSPPHSSGRSAPAT